MEIGKLLTPVAKENSFGLTEILSRITASGTGVCLRVILVAFIEQEDFRPQGIEYTPAQVDMCIDGWAMPTPEPARPIINRIVRRASALEYSHAYAA